MVLGVFGSEEAYQQQLLDDPDSDAWDGFWKNFESKLMQEAGLDEGSLMADAAKRYAKLLSRVPLSNE